MSYLGAQPAPLATQLDDNTVNTNNIVDGAVVTDDLANAAVTSAKLATGAAASNLGNYVSTVNGSTGAVTVQATLVSGTNIKTINSTSLLGSGDIAITSSPAGSNTYVQYNNSGSFGGSANFVFDGTNVGIGTSSPSYKLSINTGSAGVMANFTDGVAQTIRLSTGSGFAAIDNPSAGALAFQIAGTERMRIDSSGNVGIRNTTPSSFLSNWNGLAVGSTSGNNGIAIVCGTANYGTLAFADGTTTTEQYKGYIQYEQTNDYMVFGTTAAERFRIGSAGQLGIGGANYGTSGQALVSNGSGSAPSWQTVGSSTTYGAIGTYVIATWSTRGWITPGTTTAASNLKTLDNRANAAFLIMNSISFSDNGGSGNYSFGGATSGYDMNHASRNLGLSGTWQAMCYSGATTNNTDPYYALNLWVRIS